MESAHGFVRYAENGNVGNVILPLITLWGLIFLMMMVVHLMLGSFHLIRGAQIQTVINIKNLCGIVIKYALALFSTSPPETGGIKESIRIAYHRDAGSIPKTK